MPNVLSKKYETDSVVDLIEFIRDKINIGMNGRKMLKQVFGETNETYVGHFLSKFPRFVSNYLCGYAEN